MAQMGDKSELGFINVLTNENFGTFNWTSLSNLAVQKCMKEIQPDMLKSSSGTMVAVKFENVSTIHNIKTILSACPNVKKLTFIDVLIDEFRREPSQKNEKVIEHPGVTHAIIKSSTSIAKKERWLLDFLQRAFYFRKLKSFRIQKVFTDELPPELTFDFIEKYGQDLDEDVFTKFVLTHRTTLRELEIGGPGLKIHNDNTQSKDVDKLKTLQLDTLIFSMDGQGLPLFLKHQNKLAIMNCSHIFKLDPKIDLWILTSNIFDCIARNAKTLVEVKIYPIFIANASRQKLLNDNVLSMFAINCKIFEECSSLKKLILGLHAYRHEEDLANSKLATLMGTRMTNIQFIPTHLEELCLPVEEYSRDELELFANNFPRFMKLKSFYFGTSQLNLVNAYLIKLIWIKNLLNLPEVERIEFHNGRLEDEEATRKLVEEGSGGFPVTMSHNFPRYTFEISRNHLFVNLRNQML